jgi:hypothetical protein
MPASLAPSKPFRKCSHSITIRVSRFLFLSRHARRCAHVDQAEWTAREGFPTPRAARHLQIRRINFNYPGLNRNLRRQLQSTHPSSTSRDSKWRLCRELNPQPAEVLPLHHCILVIHVYLRQIGRIFWWIGSPGAQHKRTKRECILKEIQWEGLNGWATSSCWAQTKFQGWHQTAGSVHLQGPKNQRPVL